MIKKIFTKPYFTDILQSGTIFRKISNTAQILRKWEYTSSAEIEFARNVLLKHFQFKQEQYNSTLVQELFKSQDSNIFGRYNELSNNLVHNLDELSTEELIGTLSEFSHISRITHNAWPTLRVALGDVCAKRSDQFDLNQLFLVCDIWMSMPTSFQTRFSTIVCDAMEKHVLSMSHNELVVSIFFATRLANEGSLRNIFDQRLEAFYESLTMDQLGIVALSYFRASFPMNSGIITYIYENLLTPTVICALSDMTLVSFLKVKLPSRQLSRHSSNN